MVTEEIVNEIGSGDIQDVEYAELGNWRGRSQG